MRMPGFICLRIGYPLRQMIAACWQAIRRLYMAGDAMCVRFGPTRPFVPVPRIVWHWAHTLVVNICRPRAGDRVGRIAAVFCFAGVQPRVEFFVGDSAMTVKRIFACW